jgi:exocyst complex component 2
MALIGDVQNIRLLLVVSNLAHLNKSLIPGMLNQLQSSFGIAMDEARRVCYSQSSQLGLV